jgi:hypothetical protein
MPYEESSKESKTPENQDKPLSEERDVSQPDYKFVPGNHLWKQQGPYLVCYGCELQHAVWVGVDKLMVGVNDKGPIIKDRSEIYSSAGEGRTSR